MEKVKFCKYFFITLSSILLGLFISSSLLDVAIITILLIFSIIGSIIVLVNCLDSGRHSPENFGSKSILISMFVISYIFILGNVICTAGASCKNLYNENITYKYELSKINQSKEGFYDKLWKTYQTKSDICNLNKESFITVTKIIMSNRKDGNKLSWKWVQENQQIPYNEFTNFYKDLSIFIESQRDEYYKIELSAQEVVKKQNILLEGFPNKLYNKILNIEKLKFEYGFLSTKTNKTFENNLEDNLQ